VVVVLVVDVVFADEVLDVKPPGLEPVNLGGPVGSGFFSSSFLSVFLVNPAKN
jgi:hypothetical protein